MALQNFTLNIDSSVKYYSYFDGYIGFAPYTANELDRGNNFMDQLKQKGLIDYNILSINSHVDEDGI